MAGHDVVVIGGSAGGLEAVKQLCSGLPADFPAAVFVVIHISPNSRSILPELLTRAGKLPAFHPASGDPVVPGRIYVAPPDRHLLLQRDHVLLGRGPHENRTRPAIDPLFRSAAIAFGPRVIGVVLSGLLDDGADGLVAIKACGGICVVQQPDDAIWPEMPRSALRRDHADYCEPVAAMPALLARLVREPPGPAPPVPQNLILEANIAAQEVLLPADQMELGHPSRLSCPQCGGVLNEITEPGSIRFRCQVGHGFTTEGLLKAQNDELDRALESAMPMHRERVALFRRMQRKSEAEGLEHAAAHWRARADESEQAATLIAQTLETMRKTPG